MIFVEERGAILARKGWWLKPNSWKRKIAVFGRKASESLGREKRAREEGHAWSLWEIDFSGGESEVFEVRLRVDTVLGRGIREFRLNRSVRFSIVSERGGGISMF